MFTGSPDWEVCATGNDIDLPDPDPTLASINMHIAACNAGVAIDPDPLTPTNDTESPSLGWVGTMLGNNPKGVMGLVTLTGTEPPQFDRLCRAAPGTLPTQGDMLFEGAQWMWFDDDVGANPSAFQSNGSTRGDFLIFRIPISAIVVIE